MSDQADSRLVNDEEAADMLMRQVIVPADIPRLLATRAELVKALPDPDKLERLARYFDIADRLTLAASMGVTPAEVPDYLISAMEVQRDLRAWASAARDLLTRLQGGSDAVS